MSAPGEGHSHSFSRPLGGGSAAAQEHSGLIDERRALFYLGSLAAMSPMDRWHAMVAEWPAEAEGGLDRTRASVPSDLGPPPL